MTDTKKEFDTARRRARYYRRQSRASIVAFAIAVGLLAFMTHQSISYRDALWETTQAMESRAQEAQDIDAMVHYIRTLQGSLNSCRVDAGLPRIQFERY